MRNYIDEIDDGFVRDFLTEYLKVFTDGRKASAVIGKKENEWVACCIIGESRIYKLTFIFENFSAKIKGDEYAPQLKTLWVYNMYKKFGDEYVKDLETAYNVPHKEFDK